jgi:hypothetical protein
MFAIVTRICTFLTRAAKVATVIVLSVFPMHSAGATEAQARPAAIPAEASVTERLARDGYEMVGAPVRKGELVVLSASRTGTVWRLVIDPRTGGIIGQRPVGSPPPSQP